MYVGKAIHGFDMLTIPMILHGVFFFVFVCVFFLIINKSWVFLASSCRYYFCRHILVLGWLKILQTVIWSIRKCMTKTSSNVKTCTMITSGNRFLALLFDLNACDSWKMKKRTKFVDWLKAIDFIKVNVKFTILEMILMRYIFVLQAIWTWSASSTWWTITWSDSEQCPNNSFWVIKSYQTSLLIVNN